MMLLRNCGGLVRMKFGLVHYSSSLPEGQVQKQVVFPLCSLEIYETLELLNIITFPRKTRYLDIHFQILTKTPQFAKQTENSFSTAIGLSIPNNPTAIIPIQDKKPFCFQALSLKTAFLRGRRTSPSKS